MPSKPIERYLPPLNEKSRRWVRFGAVVAAVWLLGYLALLLSDVLTPLVAALAIAYILNPAVTWLERERSVSRVTSVTTGLIAIVLSAGVLMFALVIQLLGLADLIPRYFAQAMDWLAEHFPNVVGALDAPAAVEPAATQPADPDAAPASNYVELTQLAREYGLQVSSRLFAFATAALSSLAYIVTVIILVPLYTFFFLVEFNTIKRVVHDHLPADYRPTIVRVATTIDRAIAAFFRGRVVVCTIMGALCGIGWTIVGINHSLILGAIAGVLQLVPFLSIAVVPAAVIAAYVGVGPGESWMYPVVGAMAVYLIVQAIESFVLTPTIESRSSGLHPVTTVIALLIGGQLAGLLGMLLAIPIASTLKSLGAEYVLPEVRRLAAAGARPPGQAEPEAPLQPVPAPAGAVDVNQAGEPTVIEDTPAARAPVSPPAAAPPVSKDSDEPDGVEQHPRR